MPTVSIQAFVATIQSQYGRAPIRPSKLGALVGIRLSESESRGGNTGGTEILARTRRGTLLAALESIAVWEHVHRVAR